MSNFLPLEVVGRGSKTFRHSSSSDWKFKDTNLTGLGLIKIFIQLSWVSLMRYTASSDWKLLRFDKMEVNDFEILLSRFIFNLLKSWYLMCR